MPALTMDEDPVLKTMVAKLSDSLGDRLTSVVLYGSAARREHHAGTSDLNLLVVTSDLRAPSLEALGPAFAWWRRQGQPAPRIFSATTLADETDVFPIEFLDIRE